MVTEDQSATIAWLCAPSTHGGAPVVRIDTHASVVCLAGSRAWKLKRAVRYDYLDFSTADQRRRMCEAEVALNRRTAPSLYRGVTPITRAPDGTFAFAGRGVPVDWVIEMERFAQSDLLDQRATAGRLDLGAMAPLGRVIASFHQAAAPRFDHGGSAGMAWVVEGNARGFEEFGRCVLDPQACRRITARCRTSVTHHTALLDGRRHRGFVRQCHGDLHLRNIVLINGVPTLFDAIEFNEELSCVDVLYDLAFLLMDVWDRGLPRHANAIWNAYLVETGDYAALALMPLFLSCRAAVRAKTSATTAAMQAGTFAGVDASQRARDYLALSGRLLESTPPHLIAIGGFSGTGKTTLALRLAPGVGAVPGAVILRSDEVRKQLCGVPPLHRLGPAGYTRDISTRVYATLAERAALIVRGGQSVIVDAVFAREDDRDAIERVVADAGMTFTGLWLDAPAQLLVDRAAQRTLDASDADPTVIRQQLAAGAGMIRWPRLDAASTPDTVAADAVRIVRGARDAMTAAEGTPPAAEKFAGA